ncbi:MAG: hypothetical protein JSR21_08030 [Proteobacteria bacterium]|nr:hypothetical protein [Pseudomonadota bacterium]
MLALLGVAGCASIGPVTVPRDRVDYMTAVADSWKEQTLLNIVRLRYGDAPTFLDVSSVISGYALGGQLSAGTAISSDLTSTIPRNLVTLGSGASYVDKPTITYTPLMGDKFAKSLLRPIPPSAIFELIQAGYPSDSILQITTRAINGVYNRSTVGGQTREADPEFYPLLDALRRLQLSGAVSMRLEKRGTEEVGILVLSTSRPTVVQQDLLYVEKTLRITPEKNGELTLTFGAIPRNDREIAVLSRSMLEILIETAGGIDVPGAHVAAGRTAPATRLSDAANQRDRPLVKILSGTTPPPRPFVAVHYEDTWYWIGDDDFSSKRIFTFLMMFFSLAETGVTPQVPLLTIPAG